MRFLIDENLSPRLWPLLVTPPKVIQLRIGNVGTQEVADLLTEHHARIVAFGDDQAISLLVLP